MREILFRGKAFDGKWVEGFYYFLHSYLPTTDTIYCTEHYIVAHSAGSSIRPETVGQYTGLTDKNGKKIFEGDVLKIARKHDGTGTYYIPPLEYPVNVVVKWDMCAWMWETLCDDKRYIGFPDAWCHFECEVIGNIHDNPELLEVNDNG